MDVKQFRLFWAAVAAVVVVAGLWLMWHQTHPAARPVCRTYIGSAGC